VSHPDRQTTLQPAAVMAVFVGLIALVLFDLLIPALIVAVIAIAVGGVAAARAGRAGRPRGVELTGVLLGVMAIVVAVAWARIQGRGF
jgi:hypothetical protein